MCVLNGRRFKENNNFTCISVKGKSVIDYIFVPHSNLSNVIHFKVHCIKELLSALNIVPNRAIPDHSVISSCFQINMDDNDNSGLSKIDVANVQNNIKTFK